MQSVPTKLNSIVARKSKNGKDYWQIETDAGRMSSFEYQDVEPLMKYVGQSLTINYEMSKDGKYMNYVSFSAPTSTSDFDAKIDERNRNSDDERNRLILRQVSLKAAVDFVGTIGDENKVIEIAERFNQWLSK